MIFIGALLICIGIILIYWNISYSPMKAKFDKELKTRLLKVKENNEVCTRGEIEKLPEPLKRYCNYIWLENTPKHQVVRTVFKNTKFVFDDKIGQILDMDYDLWLFFDEFYRSAFCSSSMYGIPFEGRDYCTDEKEGGMKGILGKAIQIFDVSSKQGYEAGLISWLAEGVALNPSVLLSPYVTYEYIDSTKVKATVTYNGVSGSGIFTINEAGAITEFYSNERQVEKINGIDTRIGWKCKYEDYSLNNSILRINKVRIIKVYPDKEVIYFDSDNFEIDYLK